jgi:aminoglycoside phosphotransferase (APT) family kinase protein
MPVKTWPDASVFQACAQHPERYFRHADLREANFEPDRRRGGVQVWSGARATVLRANRPAGSGLAVRLSKQHDRDAAGRYDELCRFLASNRVPTMVHPRWRSRGLRIGDDEFPILTMDWVDGRTLDNHIGQLVGSAGGAADLTALAAAWRESCRTLSSVGLAHGDVHAGNTMVRTSTGRSVELRLVDYDNVWFPGSAAPVKEVGHPAFTHPRRSELPAGPGLDALPNTLTYLSLTALAGDPGLWRFHRADDCLLFDRSDLADPSR